MAKDKKNRLIADVSAELHKEIKMLAAWKNMSIKQYLIQALTKQINEDKKYL